MASYLCNRYRIIVLILVALIIWQVVRLFYVKPQEAENIQDPLVQLEDEKYNKHKQENVKVKVFYEALCPDSKHFFMRHLRPVTEKLSEYLDVHLVPYGKAHTKEKNGHYFFQCQHGEEECYANKIHACSIEVLSNMTLSVEFTECMILDNMQPDDALTRCGKQINIETETISQCANGEQGALLLKGYGEETIAVKPSFIPTITINGSRGNQAAILKNFLLEVCKEINIPLPAPCL